MCTPPAILHLLAINNDCLHLPFHKIAFLSTLNPILQQTGGSGKRDLFEKISQNPLLLMLVGSVITLLLMPLLRFIFKSIWEALKKLFTNLSRNKKSQRDYLNWAIQSNKFISVLPSTMAGVKTGTLHLMERKDEFDLLLHVYHDIKEVAASALGNLGQGDECVITALLIALKDGNEFVRGKAASVLGNLKKAEARVITALLSALKDGDRYDRQEIVVALRNLRPADERGITTLLDALKDGDRYVRQAAALALGNLGQADKRVITALRIALKHTFSEFDVTGAVASALGKLSQLDERVVVALSPALLAIGMNKEIKEATVSALLKILLSNNYATDALKKILPKQGIMKFFITGKMPLYLLGESSSLGTSYGMEAISLANWQSVFDTPNAVRTIIKAFMHEEATDSIYYALPFFNIRRLKLPIALELVQELANPMTDERTKLIIFQLLMRVELIDEQGQPLQQEQKTKSSRQNNLVTK